MDKKVIIRNLKRIKLALAESEEPLSANFLRTNCLLQFENKNDMDFFFEWFEEKGYFKSYIERGIKHYYMNKENILKIEDLDYYG